MITPQGLDQLLALASLTDGIERSWSMAQNGAVEERFLLFFGDIDDRVNLIAQASSALGAPPAMIDAWQSRFHLADSVGIAVNIAGSSVRLYVQYWDRLAQRVQQGDFSPCPLYWGIKFLPDFSLREDVYICLPQVGSDVFWPPIHKAFAAMGIDPARLDIVLQDLTDQSCIFTYIQDSARQSWLATVRRADPNRADLSHALAECFGAAPQIWQKDVIAQAANHDFLHIAGGQDPIKGQFTTLYFESDAQQLQSVLGQTLGRFD